MFIKVHSIQTRHV